MLDAQHQERQGGAEAGAADALDASEAVAISQPPGIDPARARLDMNPDRIGLVIAIMASIVAMLLCFYVAEVDASSAIVRVGVTFVAAYAATFLFVAIARGIVRPELEALEQARLDQEMERQRQALEREVEEQLKALETADENDQVQS